MKRFKETELYKTSDIAIASALYCLGYAIDTVDKSEPKAVFIFERDKPLDEITAAFWSRKLELDALTYFNAIKQVKSRLYNVID